MKTLLFIPARGGSKTIEMKNLELLNGEPLLYWHIKKCKEWWPELASVVSTDNTTIFDFCESHGMAVTMRPRALEDGPVHLAVQAFLEDHPVRYDAVVLLQPTSPFVTTAHLSGVISKLGSGEFASAQTIHQVPHNYHSQNQRLLSDDSEVAWATPASIRQQQKQFKPKHWAFGNLVGALVPDITDDMFPGPSAGIPINRYDSLDLDGPEDFAIAEAYLKQGLVSL